MRLLVRVAATRPRFSVVRRAFGGARFRRPRRLALDHRGESRSLARPVLRTIARRPFSRRFALARNRRDQNSRDPRTFAGSAIPLERHHGKPLVSRRVPPCPRAARGRSRTKARRLQRRSSSSIRSASSRCLSQVLGVARQRRRARRPRSHSSPTRRNHRRKNQDDRIGRLDPRLKQAQNRRRSSRVSSRVARTSESYLNYCNKFNYITWID